MASGSPFILCWTGGPNICGCGTDEPVTNWIPETLRTFCPWHEKVTKGRKKQTSAKRKTTGDNFLALPFTVPSLANRRAS
jgi:hypothetical protein